MGLPWRTANDRTRPAPRHGTGHHTRGARRWQPAARARHPRDLRKATPAWHRHRHRRSTQKVRLRTYTLPGGWQVLVGRTDADNDYLSFEVARPDDWWLHIRGMPGSHVILQGPPGTDPDRETLHRAAAIAAYHSKARMRGWWRSPAPASGTSASPGARKRAPCRSATRRVFKVRPARGDLAGEPGHASAITSRAVPPWRPAVTGAYVGAGSHVTAWAGAAAPREAGTRPRPPTAQRGS